MQNRYIKKDWHDEDEDVYIDYYFHFYGEDILRQLEIHKEKVVALTQETPVIGEDFLYDQNFSDIEWSPNDFITENEFNSIWDKYKY